MFLTSRQSKKVREAVKTQLCIALPPLGQKSPPLPSLGAWKIKVSKYSHITSIDRKFYVLSEKYKSCNARNQQKNPSGQNSLIDICASTTALTQFSTSESCISAFAASRAVLFTSTINKFLAWFWLFLQWSSIWVKHHPTQTWFDLLEVGVDFELGASCCFVK